ncbi:MAG TPA: hypothetical protein VEB21_08080 [Terriglobales bacterium]|nr:hypothetical protein [Terriglobales bacterium]
MKMMSRVARVGCLPLLSLLACLILSGCGDDSDSTSAPLPTPAAVSRSETIFIDSSRPTARNGSFPGAPERALRTVVWLPAGTQRRLPQRPVPRP